MLKLVQCFMIKIRKLQFGNKRNYIYYQYYYRVAVGICANSRCNGTITYSLPQAVAPSGLDAESVMQSAWSISSSA